MRFAIHGKRAAAAGSNCAQKKEPHMEALSVSNREALLFHFIHN
jgi:hypothetical protein